MKGKKAKALLAMLLAVQMAASGATVAFAQGATLDVAPQPSQVLVEEQEGVVYLSDLQWTDMTTAWGEPQKDQGLDENPIQFRDGNGSHIVYEKGICIHAPSSLTYSIENMGVEAFEAVIGIHDGDNNDKKEKSSCEFVVEIDGEEAYRSDVRKMDSGPLPIHVDIPADAKTLTLITTDGGDGDKQGDHSTWADAKLLLDESILQNLKSISLQADNQMLQPGEQVPVSVSGTLVNGDAAVFAPGDLVFTSDHPEVASVSADGVVTANENGVAQITCEATLDGITRSASLEFIVGDEVEGRVWTLPSPNGSIEAVLRLSSEGSLSYIAMQEGKTVLDWAALGMETSVADFSTGLEYSGVSEIKQIDETYTVPSRKKAEYVNRAQERTISFTKDGVPFDVTVRSYDDGIAVRYAIHSDEDFEITAENTAFQVPQGSTLWHMPYGSGGFSYEGSFSENPVESVTGNQSIPLLVKTPDDIFALITEADLSGGYSGSMVKADGTGLLQVVPSLEQGSNPINAEASFVSPWRTAIIGGLDDIVENTMVENLSPDPDPEVQDDYSWVEPGVSSWTWLVGGFNMQSNTTEIKRYIDFAAEMGWDYFIMDRGWQPEAPNPDGQRYAYEGYFDWYDEIQAYADEKGVGLIAWVICDDLNTPEKRAERLPEWAAKGIKGIKVDFFDSEAQDRMQLYEDIYKDCAKYGLIVNAHGANKPSGEVRTYPNVLTREAIRGEEHSLTPFQYSVIPFTRAAIGPADVTEQIYPRGSNQTTTGFQLALSVLVQSGMHCLASSIEDYRSSPAYSFYQNMPVVWDDTKLIDGYPGDFTTMVRRDGEDWYGACVSVDARNAEFPLDFLGDGTYYALIYRDGTGDKNSMTFEARTVTKEDTLSIPVKAGGGCAVKILREKPTSLESIVLDRTELSLEEGQSDTLQATLLPEDALVKDLAWSSSDESVATVSGGKVTAVKPGTAVIIASSALDPEVKAECTVTVTAKPFILNEDFWSIVREDPANIRLNGENSVTITSQRSDVGKPDGDSMAIKNMVVSVPQDENFTVTVKVTGDLYASFQTAGLVAFTDEKHLMGAMRRYHERLGGNIFECMRYEGSYDESTLPDEQKGVPAWLKLEKNGTTFTAYYSYDNAIWVKIDEKTCNSVGNAATEDIKIGVIALNGGQTVNTDITFEDFTYQAEGAEQATVLPFAVANPEAEPQEQNLTATYNNKDVTLTVDGEPQKIADLLGKFEMKDVADGTEVELTFVPRVAGKNFRSVSINGGEPQLISGDSYTYTATVENGSIALDFVFEVTDKRILEETYNYAKTYVDDGTVDSLVTAAKEAFMEAYDAAAAVLADDAATQAQIDAAWSGLLNVIHYLDFQAGDASALEDLYNLLSGLVEDDFTSDSWAAFAGAMAQAAEVIADGEPLEADVTKAYDGLLNAAEGLVRASDRSSLNDLIEKAEAVAAEIAEGKYLPDGQEAFQAALDAAKALTKDDAQATIDAAAQTLTEAMAALRKKADKSELEALLNELEALDASDYTATSYAAVAASIANLKTLLADETLDAEEGQVVVDNAVAQARAAKANLVEVNNSGSNAGSSGGSTSANVGNAYGAAGVVSAGQSVAANAYVVSDTTVNFTLKHGQAYCFKMTVVNGNAMTPSFTVGNGDVLKTQFVAKIGNDYYYRVYAIGTPGQSTGVYTTLPGQNATKHCAVTIG